MADFTKLVTRINPQKFFGAFLRQVPHQSGRKKNEIKHQKQKYMQILKGVFITGEKFQYRFISETADYFRVQKRNDIGEYDRIANKSNTFIILKEECIESMTVIIS